MRALFVQKLRTNLKQNCLFARWSFRATGT